MGRSVLTPPHVQRKARATPAHSSANTSSALASWRGVSTIVVAVAEKLPLPAREDADAYAPRLRWERELVDTLLEPALRYYAAQVSAAGRDAAPEAPPPPAGIWPPNLQALHDVYAAWLNARTIARAALAYTWHIRLTAGERARLAQALRLDSSAQWRELGLALECVVCRRTGAPGRHRKEVAQVARRAAIATAAPDRR
jgi:hypothetical protein